MQRITSPDRQRIHGLRVRRPHGPGIGFLFHLVWLFPVMLASSASAQDECAPDTDLGCGIIRDTPDNLERFREGVDAFVRNLDETGGPFEGKRLRGQGLRSLSFDGCRIEIVAEVTLERRIRRNAHGTVTLSGDMSLSLWDDGGGDTYLQVCIDDPRVTDVDLSRSTPIAEGIYRRAFDQKLRDGGSICTDERFLPTCSSHANESLELTEDDADRLCDGAISEEPGRCFDRVVGGGVDWGGGTAWNPENAIRLCKATADSETTIDCFEGMIDEGLPWDRAIRLCSGANSPVCFESIQGEVAYDYRGRRNWNSANVRRLCRGAEASEEPARCFEAVMHGDDPSSVGGLDWGGGTLWHWRNAVRLCAGTTDAAVTVKCFQRALCDGETWPEAIEMCRVVPGPREATLADGSGVRVEVR